MFEFVSERLSLKLVHVISCQILSVSSLLWTTVLLLIWIESLHVNMVVVDDWLGGQELGVAQCSYLFLFPKQGH